MFLSVFSTVDTVMLFATEGITSKDALPDEELNPKAEACIAIANVPCFSQGYESLPELSVTIVNSFIIVVDAVVLEAIVPLIIAPLIFSFELASETLTVTICSFPQTTGFFATTIEITRFFFSDSDGTAAAAMVLLSL